MDENKHFAIEQLREVLQYVDEEIARKSELHEALTEQLDQVAEEQVNFAYANTGILFIRVEMNFVQLRQLNLRKQVLHAMMAQLTKDDDAPF